MHVLPLFLTAHVVFSAVCTKADITALNTAFDIAVNRKAQPCLDFIPRIKKLDLDERQKEYCEGNVCDTFLIALDGFTDYPDCIHEGEAVSVSLPRAFDDLVIRIDTLRKTAWQLWHHSKQEIMQYLILFAHRHVDFRLPELDVLLEMQGLNPEVCYDRQAAYDRMKANPTSVSPLLSVQLPSEQHAIILAERGVLVRAIYEFFAIGSDYNSLISELQGAMPRLVPFATSSWRLDIEAFGRRFSMTEQTERRELVKPYLIDAFPGPVKMKDPNEWFLILEEYAVNTLPHELLHVYFVRTLAGNYRSKIPGGSRALVHTLTLKKRAYIGPTSMDTELALIMANMGQVTPCDFVLDPFVGTGSILIPCAAFGAFTFGTDIDIRILRGKKGKNLFSNFAQYKLPFPELLRSDTSRPNWYGENIFDAIICDPPYGIRAGARKSGCPIEELKEIPEEFHESHIPKTQCYEGDDMMHDLLQLAATALKPGGRLVYLIPTPYDFENSDLPTHPNLKFIASSEQGLSTHVARRLVTMEKRLILSNAPAPRTCRLFQKLREIRTAL